MEWVPVDERNPTPGAYLVNRMYDSGISRISLGFYNYSPVGDDMIWTVADFRGVVWPASGVTHWMPIPEGPRGTQSFV